MTFERKYVFFKTRWAVFVPGCADEQGSFRLFSDYLSALGWTNNFATSCNRPEMGRFGSYLSARGNRLSE